MIYETRKILVGFRLKLNFDPTLKQQDTFVYVDIAKTPTVAALLDNIADSFQIPNDGLNLFLSSCKLRPHENVCILADVDEARFVISITFYIKVRFRTLTLINVCRISTSCTRASNAEVLQSSIVQRNSSACDSIKRNENMTLDNDNENGGNVGTSKVMPSSVSRRTFSDVNSNKKTEKKAIDDVDGANETKAPKIFRSHAREGVAYFLEKLREMNTETETDTPDFLPQQTHKKRHDPDSLLVNMSCDISGCNGDISESIPTDNQEFVSDAKRRKRKRKHSKKLVCINKAIFTNK